MTEEQTTAKGLLEHFGKEKALAHIAYVLSPAFELHKPHLRLFWCEVRNEILTPKDTTISS